MQWRAMTFSNFLSQVAKTDRRYVSVSVSASHFIIRGCLLSVPYRKALPNMGRAFQYTRRLYSMEHWFGVQNGAIGGVGSRVFDVSCNGTMLLKGFDIYRGAGSEGLVKSFQHIEPTPQGKIEIYFTPNVNYPSVSAIEVLPE